MSRRRIVVAVGAALVAALAVGMLAQGRSGDGAVGAEVVTVVRVATDIARGTPATEALADGSLVVVEVPATDPSLVGAVAPAALEGTVALAPIPAGGLLTQGLFALPAGPGTELVSRLPTPGHTALAVTVDATRAVGGWVQPGDRVNLLVPGVCADEPAAQADAAAGDAGTEVRCRRARYLYQAVDVLAVGTSLSPVGDQSSGGMAAGPVTIVLSLPPRAAQWVATWENELTLTLVPADYVPRVVDPLPVLVERLPGEQEGTLQPGCADPAAPGPAGEEGPCAGVGTP